MYMFFYLKDIKYITIILNLNKNVKNIFYLNILEINEDIRTTATFKTT